ncbi:MAG: hypothetical protein WAW41_01100 [Methylobacter sp.]
MNQENDYGILGCLALGVVGASLAIGSIAWANWDFFIALSESISHGVVGIGLLLAGGG